WPGCGSGRKWPKRQRPPRGPSFSCSWVQCRLCGRYGGLGVSDEDLFIDQDHRPFQKSVMVQDQVFVVLFAQLLLVQSPLSEEYGPSTEKGFMAAREGHQLLQLLLGNGFGFDVLQFHPLQGLEIFQDSLTGGAAAQMV